jgi:hypothetical protein
MTSQINPNNIDGNYPVPGISNNTQGMRDNFTNTKTNFQYAADEISQLQNYSVFKTALPGSTLDNNMNDNLLYAVKLQDVSYTLINLPGTSGSIVLDYSAGMFQQINLTGPISLSFANFPQAGTVGVLRVAFNITNINQTVTLPAVVSQGLAGLEGISPGTPGQSNTITFGTTGNYAFEFLTPDGGATVWLFDDSRPNDKFFGQVEIANTAASISTTTGALVVDGGIGVAGNVYAGAFYGDGSTLSNIFPNYVFNGNSFVGIGSANGNANISIGNSANVVVVSTDTVTVNGSVLLKDGGGIGYTVGAGGSATQGSNKSNEVEINKPSGVITINNQSLNANTSATFTLTNNNIANTDLLVINHVSTGVGNYLFNCICNTGSANITITNRTGGSLSESPVIRFALIKGAIT